MQQDASRRSSSPSETRGRFRETTNTVAVGASTTSRNERRQHHQLSPSGETRGTAKGKAVKRGRDDSDEFVVETQGASSSEPSKRRKTEFTNCNEATERYGTVDENESIRGNATQGGASPTSTSARHESGVSIANAERHISPALPAHTQQVPIPPPIFTRPEPSPNRTDLSRPRVGRNTFLLPHCSRVFFPPTSPLLPPAQIQEPPQVRTMDRRYQQQQRLDAFQTSFESHHPMGVLGEPSSSRSHSHNVPPRGVSPVPPTYQHPRTRAQIREEARDPPHPTFRAPRALSTNTIESANDEIDRRLAQLERLDRMIEEAKQTLRCVRDVLADTTTEYYSVRDTRQGLESIVEWVKRTLQNVEGGDDTARHDREETDWDDDREEIEEYEWSS